MSDFDPDLLELDLPAPTPEARTAEPLKLDLPEADLTRSQASKIGTLFHDMAVTVTAWAAAKESSDRAALALKSAREAESTLEEELANRARETESRSRWNEAPITSQAQVAAEPEMARAIQARDIIIGAHAEGAGGLTGWVGNGELTRGQILSALERAAQQGHNIHEGWAPNPKSVVGHMGTALQALCSEGRVVRADRGGRRRGQRLQCTDGRVREFMGRWIVGNANVRGGQVGDEFGTIVLTVLVYSDGRCECVGDSELCARVTLDYQRRRDSEAYSAAEVTLWLRSLLLSKFNAVRLGGNWFVPRERLAKCEALISEISQVWGCDWLPVPFLPLASSAQLLSGLAHGFVREVREALADFASQREQARKQGQADLGPRGAITVYRKLMSVRDKAKSYAALVGEENIATVRAELQAAIDTVTPLCDDISLRYAMLDL